jgi:uncharacterized protein (TIGR00369 family)
MYSPAARLNAGYAVQRTRNAGSVWLTVQGTQCRLASSSTAWPSDFCNPAGFIQGGFLAAMLDDTMGPAILVKSDGTVFTPTIDLHVSFLAPARPGNFVGEGKVVQLGKTIAFVEGALFDDHGILVAKATASARVVPTSRL